MTGQKPIIPPYQSGIYKAKKRNNTLDKIFTLLVIIGLGFTIGKRTCNLPLFLTPLPAVASPASSKPQLGDLLNDYRETNNLKPLRWNNQLYQSASASAVMLSEGERTWSHDGYIRIIKHYYGRYAMIGENLARDFTNNEAVLVGWVNSPGHNDNLLNQKACEYGLAHFNQFYVLHIGCKHDK